MKEPIALFEDTDSGDEQTNFFGNIVTVQRTKRNTPTPFWLENPLVSKQILNT